MDAQLPDNCKGYTFDAFRNDKRQAISALTKLHPHPPPPIPSLRTPVGKLCSNLAELGLVTVMCAEQRHTTEGGSDYSHTRAHTHTVGKLVMEESITVFHFTWDRKRKLEKQKKVVLKPNRMN